MIDVHCHLTHPPLSFKRQIVVTKAKEAGVKIIIDSVTDWNIWESEILRKEEGVCISPGIHPQSIVDDDFSRQIALLSSLAKNFRVAAIGEIGYDTLKNTADLKLQRTVFNLQLEIAHREQIPVIIHCLGQYDLLLRELKGMNIKVPLILHRYSGGDGQVRAFSALGCYFSVSADVLNPKNKKLRKSVESIPSELMLAETDSPYFFFGGKPNSGTPAQLPLVIEEIAKIKKMSFEKTRELIYENARRIFKKRIFFEN
ncbi:TatD family hydrolase [candidate division WOR-3 bacterium]|nr:TatD family hydrolase [candidate division WOR-3 bacterium]